jgi:hypothetical protein
MKWCKVPKQQMTEMEAIRAARKLYEIWVSSAVPGYNLDQIRKSMLQDFRYRRERPQFAAVTREIRGQLILLGKIRKVLAAEGKGE